MVQQIYGGSEQAAAIEPGGAGTIWQRPASRRGKPHGPEGATVRHPIVLDRILT